MGQSKVVNSKKGTVAYVEPSDINVAADPIVQYMSKDQLEKNILKTKKAMEAAAKELDFMEAARLRDEMYALKELLKARH